MTDYQIEPNTRRCAATGRELQPGERYFAVLRDEAGHFVRLDYSAEAWQGPPPGTFSFWAGRVPTETEDRKPQFDDDLLVECFERLQSQEEPGRVRFRYVVALLLMRRKRLRFEEARAEQGREILVLKCSRTGAKHQVVNPGMTEEEMASVQDEVFKVLGWQ
jgi:hypothetical protein